MQSKGADEEAEAYDRCVFIAAKNGQFGQIGQIGQNDHPCLERGIAGE